MIANREKNIMLGIFVLVCLYFLYHNVRFDLKLAENYSFTIGKTVGFSGRGGTQRNVDFIYYVNNVKYHNSTGRNYNIAKPIGRFYKVKYSNSNPEISQIDFTNEIFDSLSIVNANLKFTGK